MSLSQKHAGLILVPWFNSDEWRYVYHFAYSKERDKQLKALDQLKIWKLRTPILSTGVEGTLILLEALLLDTEQVTSRNLAQLYALALMRFLNLSAANSDKQGSFTKTSEKHELPKWLVNLRHDIAHGHHIPSLSNLKMGLDFGFGWLKEKYWEPQSKIIKDYYIGDDSTSEYDVPALTAYVGINVAVFENQVLNDDYIQNVKDLIYKELRKTIAEPCLMLSYLMELITRRLERNRQKKRLCLDELASPRGMLKPNFEVLLEEEGNESLNKNFKNIWESLLNTLHQHGLLFALIEKLFEVIGNISYTDNSKKMAAMWIKELFVSLKYLKKESMEGDPMKLQASQFNYAAEAVKFEKRVLNCPDQYTVYFLDSLLVYNSRDDSLSDDILNLIKAKSEVETNLHRQDGKIYTLDDLNIENLSLNDFPIKDVGEEQSGLHEINPKSSRIVAGPKWRKLEDTSLFKNCPLGVLPHQRGQKHPFLVLN